MCASAESMVLRSAPGFLGTVVLMAWSIRNPVESSVPSLPNSSASAESEAVLAPGIFCRRCSTYESRPLTEGGPEDDPEREIDCFLEG